MNGRFLNGIMTKSIVRWFKTFKLDNKNFRCQYPLNEIDDEEKIKEDVFQSGEAGESINRMIVKINNVLKTSELSNSPSPEGPSTSISSESQQTHPSSVRAKLPKLSLKKFNGNPTDWQSFCDSYTTAVHSNASLSKVDKFNYLKSLVEGPAAATIAGFSLTEEIYDTAFNLLKDRFANPQVIVSSHVNALLKLESVSNIHDIAKIRKLYDSIETHILSLANLDISSESFGTILIPMILAKLPVEMQLLISRKVGKDQWKLDELLKEFKVELEARERCCLLHSASERKDHIKKRNEPCTSSALFNASDNRPTQR